VRPEPVPAGTRTRPAHRPARGALGILALVTALVGVGPPAAATGPAWRIAHVSRVSRDPVSLGTRTSEPIVAAHPTDPRRIAAVFPDGNETDGTPTIRISRDGGRTWADVTGRPVGGGNHPVIAWGPGPRPGSARLYYSGMAGLPGDLHHAISWSDDEGRSWSRPWYATGTRGWFGGYPDMLVDNDPGSPGYGVLYHVYNWPKDPERGPGMRVLASADHGRTFAQVEIPKATPPAGFDEAWRIGYRLATGPGGTLYVSGYQADLRAWDPAYPFAKGDVGNIGRLAFTVTRVTFDRASGALVAGPTRVAARLPVTAWNLGRTGTGLHVSQVEPSWASGLAVDRRGHVWLAAGVDGGILLAIGTDRGRRWVTRRLPRPPAVAGRRQVAFRPQVVAGRGFVAVLAGTADDRVTGRSAGRIAAVTRDGGRTWLGPTALTSVRWLTAPVAALHNGPGLRERAVLLAGGRALFYAWGDGRDGWTSIWGARIAVPPAPTPAPTPTPGPTLVPSPAPPG